ncbi:SH3 domain-containing protein [Methylocystis parvus]|uniref:SH3 domain-containing protein n=1 Tax=Methylocystis parvus TaxID=134 RepID=UPI003C75994E
MFRPFGLLLALALLPAAANGQDAVKVTRVGFRDGHASLRGSVTGYETRDYVFPANAGESIAISLKTNRLSNYFNLTAPGADEALFIGSTSGASFSGAAPVSGDYTARVYLMRNDARRGVKANYVLNIALGMKSAGKPNGPDFADGLTGGPDYWEVTDVPAGDRLSVRATPSPKGKLVTQALNSAIMKNLGCRNTRGQRWCQVEDGAGRRGWVNGKYLREGAPPSQ